MKNPFSLYGRVVRAMPSVTGKTFILASATSTYLSELQDSFPVDEDGVPRVYTTLAAVNAALVSGRGDAILVMPGTYTVATVVALTANDVTIVGVGSAGAAMFVGSAANILTVTGTNFEMSKIGMTIASTKAALILTGADYHNIHDNVFVSSVGGAASHFIQSLTTASNYGSVRNNKFVSNLDVSAGAVTQTSQITLLGVGNVIEDNLFVAGRVTTANAGAVTDAILCNSATASGNLVRRNTFIEVNGATFTAGVESGASSVSGSIFPVSNNFLLGTAANAIVNTTGSAGFDNNVANGTV